MRLDGRLRGVIVYDQKLYARTGMVSRWFRGLGREYERNAKALAPVGRAPKGPSKRPPGDLKASINVEVNRVAPRGLQMEVNIGVNYARFVVRGTDPIIEHGGKGFRIYWQQLGPYPKKRPRVARKPVKGINHVRHTIKGQRRNAFLDRATRVTAARHPSIRGLSRRKIGLL